MKITTVNIIELIIKHQISTTFNKTWAVEVMTLNSVLRHLKQHRDNAVNAYMTANPGRIVIVYTNSTCCRFHTAWDKAVIPDSIHFGFRATGVYPVNRHAVKIPREHESRSCAEVE